MGLRRWLSGIIAGHTSMGTWISSCGKSQKRCALITDMACNPSAGKVGTGGSLGPEDQQIQSNKFQVQWQTLYQKNKGGGEWLRKILSADLWLPHACVPKYTCAHTNTHIYQMLFQGYGTIMVNLFLWLTDLHLYNLVETGLESDLMHL